MSPRALLLSPDDQAVSAITGVLQEMSVDCERPMDGATAAQKLNSQTYDLVLVDCDNLPAAKLIFDVCRRANAGTTIPIAIVDGRAGLPTAFRLGAELILTKPVAKDQARTTVRTAVSRLRKEAPAPAVKPLEAPVVGAPGAIAAAEPAAPAARAQAAAAAASSVPAMAPDMNPAPAVDLPKIKITAEPAAIATTSPVQRVAESLTSSEIPARAHAVPASPAPKALAKTADDPVLKELEKAESELQTPVFSSYQLPPKRRKGRGALVALLVLGLAGGGFYGAWTLQPDFRAMVQPQLEKVSAIVGMPPQQKHAVPAPIVPPPVKASVPQPGPAPQPVAASTATAVPDNASQQRAPSSATSSAADSVTPKASTPAKAETGENGASEAEGNKKAAASETELPWEKDTVILSSKGAEKRLVHHVQPTYPSEARGKRVEGTVVLKTLVNSSGGVAGVRLIEGNANLAEAATKAVKQWRYKPYLRDGNRTPFQTIVIVDFQQP